MNKKPPLSNKKKAWVKNRDVVLRGEPLNYNASQQRRHSMKIKRLIKFMANETKKQLLELFNSKVSINFFNKQKEQSKIVLDESISSIAKSVLNSLQDKFDKLFNSKAKEISNKMIDDLSKISQNNLHSSLKKLSGGLSLKTGVVTAGVKDVATAIVAENVSLIKTIPKVYFKNITGSVMRSITTGNGLADLVPEINEYAKTTQRKAEFMALDQTRKAYNSINKQRMIYVGIKKFEWMHTSGSIKPREWHIKMDGHIFSFENLEEEQAALGVPEEDRGFCGDPPGCKCKPRPVIDFSSQEE
jgi:hypothetical protein